MNKEKQISDNLDLIGSLLNKIYTGTLFTLCLTLSTFVLAQNPKKADAYGKKLSQQKIEIELTFQSIERFGKVMKGDTFAIVYNQGFEIAKKLKKRVDSIYVLEEYKCTEDNTDSLYLKWDAFNKAFPKTISAKDQKRPFHKPTIDGSNACAFFKVGTATGSASKAMFMNVSLNMLKSIELDCDALYINARSKKK